MEVAEEGPGEEVEVDRRVLECGNKEVAGGIRYQGEDLLCWFFCRRKGRRGGVRRCGPRRRSHEDEVEFPEAAAEAGAEAGVVEGRGQEEEVVVQKKEVSAA